MASIDSIYDYSITFTQAEYGHELSSCQQKYPGNSIAEAGGLAKCVQDAWTNSQQIGANQAAKLFVQQDVPQLVREQALHGESHPVVLRENYSLTLRSYKPRPLDEQAGLAELKKAGYKVHPTQNGWYADLP